LPNISYSENLYNYEYMQRDIMVVGF